MANEFDQFDTAPAGNPFDQFDQAQTAPAPAQPPRQAPTLGSLIGSAVQGVGNEYAGGASDIANAVSNPPPEVANRLIQRFVGGTPESPINRGLGIGANVAMGAGRIAGALGQLIGSPLGKEAGYLGETLTGSPKVGNIAETGANIIGNFLAPEGLINAPLNAASRALGPLKRVQQAESLNQANTINNAYAGEKVATAERQYAKDLADFEARQASAKQAASTIAQRQPDLSIRSPIAESMRSTTPESEIYARFNAAKNEVAIPTQGVVDKSQELLSKFEKETVANAPSKVVNTADELSAAASKDLIANFQGKLQRFKGSMTLADVQTNMQDLWPLINSSDNRVSAAGNQLYREFTKSLEAAGPNGKLLLDANRKWRQNRAVDSLSEMIASPGVSKVTEKSLLDVSPSALTGKIQQQSDKMDFIRGSFTPQEWGRLTDTVEHVFHIKGQVGKAPEALSEAAKRIALEPTNIQPELPARIHGGIRQGMAIALGALAQHFGVPGGWASGYGGAIAASYAPQIYTKAIVNVAARPGGRALLERLYAGAPPSMADAAKVAALTRFLRAQETADNGKR